MAGEDAGVSLIGLGRLVRLARTARHRHQRAVARTEDDRWRATHSRHHESWRNDDLYGHRQHREKRSEANPDQSLSQPSHVRASNMCD
jgi:hypothetical protein